MQSMRVFRMSRRAMRDHEQERDQDEERRQMERHTTRPAHWEDTPVEPVVIEKHICPSCDGAGATGHLGTDDEDQCDECDGEGWVMYEPEVE